MGAASTPNDLIFYQSLSDGAPQENQLADKSYFEIINLKENLTNVNNNMLFTNSNGSLHIAINTVSKVTLNGLLNNRFLAEGELYSKTNFFLS